jgi:hypothetical protein
VRFVEKLGKVVTSDQEMNRRERCQEYKKSTPVYRSMSSELELRADLAHADAKTNKMGCSSSGPAAADRHVRFIKVAGR